MNEKTNEALLGVATQVTEWLKSAGDLVTQEAPLLAQEVVSYGVFDAIYGLIFGGVLLVVCVRLGWCAVKMGKERNEESATLVLIAFTLSTGIASFAVTCGNISQLGKTLIAPRLYLLEQMAKLVS